MSSKHIFIAAAGTGGHIIPALAISSALEKQFKKQFEQQSDNLHIHWIGTPTGMENQLVGERYPIFRIAFSGVRSTGWKRLLRLPWDILHCTYRLRRRLKQVNKDSSCLMVVMGGYISFPAALAAKSLGIKVLIQEQNAIAGTANLCLAPLADIICEGFSGAFSHTRLLPLIQSKIVITGNPIRPEIHQLRLEKRIQHFQNVLILGGSLGAQSLNQQLPKAIATLVDRQTQLSGLNFQRIIHQCGAGRSKQVQECYQQLNLRVEVRDFIDNLPDILGEVDLIIARAGASSVAEFAHIHCPTILVPFPYAINDHQRHNANWLKAQQPCQIINNADLNATSLADAINKLQQHLPYQQSNLAKTGTAESTDLASQRIVQLIQQLVH